MSNANQPSNNQDKSSKRVETQVWIALIGALATIIVALLGFPPLIARLTPTPTLTITLSPVSTSADTSVLATNRPQSTDTPEATITSTATEMAVILSTSTETPSLPIGMHVRLSADRTTGKAPLTVKLNARDSFLRAPGGDIYGCKSGACTYTWEVYAGGAKVGKSLNNSTGTFQYTFGKKGYYFITVVVCRGGESSDCNGGGVQIVAK